MHPVTREVESLIGNGEFDAASAAAERAIGAEPRNPDVIAAHGLALAYTGREDQAIELVGRACLSPMGRRMAQVLASHLISRQTLAAKTGQRDPIVHACLTKVRMQTNQPIDRVGVAISAWVGAGSCAASLRATLSSLKGAVDEIVVQSSDRLPWLIEVATEYGARVASNADPLGSCQADWILRVEAGEALSSEGVARIQWAIVRPQFAGFNESGKRRIFRRTGITHGCPYGEIEAIMDARMERESSPEGRRSEAEEPTEALSRCDLADEMGLGGPQNEFERARALLQLGRISEGLASSARCLAMAWPPDLGSESVAERYEVRGRLLAANGQHDAAAGMFDRAVHANPDLTEARLEWAKSLEKVGKFDAAFAVYASGQESPGLGSAFLAGAGRCCTRLGLAKRAADLFREAWRRNSGDASAWMAWVDAAIAYGDPVGIVEAYSSCGHDPTISAEHYAVWAEAHRALGDLAEARDRLEASIALHDAEGKHHFALAKVLIELGQWSEAAQTYELGLQLEPENIEAWIALGGLLERLGLAHGAKISCQRALALDPECAAARRLFDRLGQAA